LKTQVLDSWPIVEWIKEKPLTAEIVDNMWADAESGATRLLISAINVGEVYYYLWKYQDQQLAESWRRASVTLPITIEVPTTAEIWDAARLKGQYPISYADAFAAALAQKHRCPLITGDPEFRTVHDLQLEWIGPASL
jgi:predicted nucleic acid-binding protein